MTTEAIQNWLRRKLALHITGCWVGAVVGLVAGLLVLFMIFWLAYAMVFVLEEVISALRLLIFNHRFHFGHAWRLVISGLFLVALFGEWIRRSPWELGRYGKTEMPAGSRAMMHRAGATGALAVLLANPQASATMITEILYLGPRLVLGAGALAAEACRARIACPEQSAAVLHLLAAREGIVTHEEVAALGFEADAIKNDLARIPGMVFLEKGLSLTQELRQELAALAGEP